MLDFEFKSEDPLTRGYQHLHIPVDDVEDENLLEWFPKSNHFVQEGLDYKPGHAEDNDNSAERGSGVYIHW